MRGRPFLVGHPESLSAAPRFWPARQPIVGRWIPESDHLRAGLVSRYPSQRAFRRSEHLSPFCAWRHPPGSARKTRCNFDRAPRSPCPPTSDRFGPPTALGSPWAWQLVPEQERELGVWLRVRAQVSQTNLGRCRLQCFASRSDLSPWRLLGSAVAQGFLFRSLRTR
jgi:hypothetical protein